MLTFSGSIRSRYASCATARDRLPHLSEIQGRYRTRFAHIDAVLADGETRKKSYLGLMPFSRQRLIDQLLYEGFTIGQATYAANAVGL